MRFLRFLTVGGLSYLVQMAAMKLFLGWLDTNPAFTFAFIGSTSVHYALNRFWALPSGRDDKMRQLGEYLGVVGLSYVINFSLFRLGLAMFGLGRMWAMAVAVPPSTVVVFLLLNLRVFRRNDGLEKN